jgi:hypothetical protein
MGAIAAIIVLIWVVLVGTAVCGRKSVFPLRALGLVVTLIYAALAIACVFVLGSGWMGWVGAAGMLFPYAVAMACIFIF